MERIYKILKLNNNGASLIDTINNSQVNSNQGRSFITINVNNNVIVNQNPAPAQPNVIGTIVGTLLNVFLGKSLYIQSQYEVMCTDGSLELKELDEAETKQYQEWTKLSLDFFWWKGNNDLFKKWITNSNIVDLCKDEIYFIDSFLKVFHFNSQGISVNRKNYSNIVQFFNDDRVELSIIRYTKIPYDKLNPDINSNRNNVNKMKRSIIAYFALAFSALMSCMQTLQLKGNDEQIHFNHVLDMLDLDSLSVTTDNE